MADDVSYVVNSQTPGHCAKGSIWEIDSHPAGLPATHHKHPNCRQSRRPPTTATTRLAASSAS
jgi:hypothetical protein